MEIFGAQSFREGPRLLLHRSTWKIKQFFTSNLKFLVPAFEIFKTLLYEESLKQFKYETILNVTKTLENKSKRLETLKLVKTSGTEYFYNHKNGLVASINLLNKTFTCNL